MCARRSRILQQASRTPLLLRQVPIWNNGVAVGFIDLALERAYVYREHAPSEVVDISGGDVATEKEARYSMLERLADYDDALMEELISDIEPPRDQVFDDLTKELRAGLVVPLFIGSAERGAGVTRLLKAMRHEAPGIEATRVRLGVGESGPALARVFRTIHTPHGGKMSVARVLRGALADGQTVASPQGEDRISGMSHLMGAATSKTTEAKTGDVVALGRLDHAQTGDTIVADARAGAADLQKTRAEAPDPVHALALNVKDRKDEMRLAAAMTKLIEEDPSLVFVHDQELSQIKLFGQGEMHLRVALERLASRFNVAVDCSKPTVAYRETIRHKVTVRGRHKKQSGGHGQFGDVVMEIAPRGRGEGFAFSERVHGGSVPRQYFSSVEAGCQDALLHGPLGFPVVDVEAVLTDGSYHSVNSSDMAFRTAARIGMSEASGKGRADPAGAGARGRYFRAERRHVARNRHRLGAARPDHGLRPARGVGRLGQARNADSRGGDGQSHRRTALRDGGRGLLPSALRPSRGSRRQAGARHRRRAYGEGERGDSGSAWKAAPEGQQQARIAAQPDLAAQQRPDEARLLAQEAQPGFGVGGHGQSRVADKPIVDAERSVCDGDGGVAMFRAGEDEVIDCVETGRLAALKE